MAWSYEVLVQRWRDMCATLGVAADIDRPLRELRAAYSEEHRSYHTLEHLGECLQLLEEYRPFMEPGDCPLLELALWFHDGVYDTMSSRNEEKSADWALHWMSRWGRPGQERTRVRGLILATRHRAAPANSAESWMVDIDLGILGAESSRFQNYERQVREEYHSVPWVLYRTKRAEILQGFLDRAFIYNTPQLREHLETRARENLAWSLAQLKSGAPR